jgi:hypothetical protein
MGLKNLYQELAVGGLADWSLIPQRTTIHPKSRPFSDRDFFWNFQMVTNTCARSLASVWHPKLSFFVQKQAPEAEIYLVFSCGLTSVLQAESI